MNKDKNELVKKLAEADFVVWDLHLYLDTHPGDLAAVGLHNKYRRKAQLIRDEYEAVCGKITADAAQGVEWLRDPWPWEKGGCDC